MDWEEAEDSCSLEGTADVFDELVVPSGGNGLTLCSDDGWLCGLPESVTTNLCDAAVLQADTENAEDVTEVRATWWVEYETLAEEPQEEGKWEVEDQREEVCEPETDVFLRISCGDTHESANVDEEVEPEDHTLGGGFWVLDHSLAGLGCDDDWDGCGHLIEKERRDVGLEHGWEVVSIRSILVMKRLDIPAPGARIYREIKKGAFAVPFANRLGAADPTMRT